MTRKSSKANKEKRAKEPEVERFRSLEELNKEFSERKTGRLRTLPDLAKDFEDQGPPAREEKPRKASQSTPKEVDLKSRDHGTGVLKKIFEGRGFGFIAPDQDPSGAGDIFLHFSDIGGGGARNLGIGTWVRYDLEPDSASGRLRAKNVSVLQSTPSTAPSESPSLPPSVDLRQAAASPDLTGCIYSRDIMLGAQKALAASPHSSKTSSFRMFTVPMFDSADADEDDDDEQNPHLDDERLIARLEARLDKETGADALNRQTFGACCGWTFEEAVMANDKINEKIRVDSEDSTIAGGSFSDAADPEVSEREEEDSTSTASEDRNRRSKGREKARTLSWEAVSEKSQTLKTQRHSWEVEQKQKQSRAAPLVFQ